MVVSQVEEASGFRLESPGCRGKVVRSSQKSRHFFGNKAHHQSKNKITHILGRKMLESKIWSGKIHQIWEKNLWFSPKNAQNTFAKHGQKQVGQHVGQQKHVQPSMPKHLG
jgi:hypothetical protein